MRPYHSPSSIKLAQRCERAWAEAYINGRRSPGTPATELGTAMHTVGEDWYGGRPPAWTSLPGQIFQSGAHLLPHPKRCESVLVESPIGNVPISNPDPNGPQSVRVIDGVRWAGFRDLIAKPTRVECERLGLPYGPALLDDYKSSANIARYALTVAELGNDLQCNLYGYATCEDFDQAFTPARWVYFETKKVRRAKAVDVVVFREQALRVIEPCNTLARSLDSLVDVAAATKNPRACNDFGRVCEHHKSQPGGTCDARRSIGGLVQARVPKKETNTMDPKIAAKFAGLTKKAAAVAEAPPPEDNPDADAGEGEQEGEAPPPPPASKAKAPPAAKAVAAPVAGKPSKLAALVAKYEAKQAELAAIAAEITAAL
jgi:hypothetical protein